MELLKSSSISGDLKQLSCICLMRKGLDCRTYIIRLPHLVEKQTNKWIESHHNNGQFYYSFSHYTVHAATSCMGEIKNNRLLIIILFPLWRKNWKKRRRRIYGGENQNQFKFFFCSVYSVFFCWCSSIYSIQSNTFSELVIKNPQCSGISK